MAKKGKAKAAGKAKKGGGEILCVGSKVKGYIKSKGMKCSGDLVQALSDHVHMALDSAMARCSGNKRSTVRPVDL